MEFCHFWSREILSIDEYAGGGSRNPEGWSTDGCPIEKESKLLGTPAIQYAAIGTSVFGVPAISASLFQDTHVDFLQAPDPVGFRRQLRLFHSLS